MSTASAAPAVPATTDQQQVKAERFRNRAGKRANRILRDLELLEYTAGSYYYSTPEQREQIVSLIRGAVDRLEVKFAGAKEERPRVVL